MRLKKLCCTILCMAMLVTCLPFMSMTASAAGSETIGTVNLQGDADFDSDSIKNEEDSQWRWLGYPGSRMVTNYGKRNDKAKYDGGMNLDIAMVVDGFQTKDSLHKVQMGPIDGGVGDYQTLKTAWYPYKLTADATYSAGKLHMDEFFVDKDTFVRMIEVTDAANAKLKMSARISGITQSGDNLLISQDDYWMVYKFLKLDADGNVTGQYTPTVSGEDWYVEISFDNATAKLAFSLTMLPKNVGENSKESILALADSTVGEGKNMVSLLAATKAYWDGKLAKVPAPQKFGFEGNTSNGTISAEDHRRAFYAAWTFQYQNIVEPTPEKDYNYYQVTLGIPSTWASGSNSAPNSCSWESLFNIQELSYVEPEIAWDAMKGFIYSIDDNGILDGECLPSQKAHTTWVCYQNMISIFPDKADELNTELGQLYPYIHKYLLWRAENPRWIYGSENFANEKDISFVTQWYSDVDYAIKIANILGKYDDVAVYESMKDEMGENAREWFFAEYDTTQPDTTTNRIMAFCFLNADGTNSYSWSGSSHNGSSADALNYVYEALFADLPKDLLEKLVHSYLAFTEGKENDPLVGFEFYKYGDGCHTAYGLQEREQQYPELAGKWEEYVDAVLANAIKNVDFAECLRVNGNTTRLEGVEPSSFNASAIIDYTYMKNGVRIDMGEIVALGGDGIAKTNQTDVNVYTIKGTKPELPKTVTVEKDGKATQTLVVWPDVTEADYNSDKTTFEVTGKIYGTNLEAIATVHVYSGEVEIAAQSYSTTVGKSVEMENVVPAVYQDENGATHHCVVDVEWEEITEEQLAQKGIVTVNGKIKFNQQNITATLGVFAGPAIVCEDSIDKYSTMQLSVVNQDDPEETYQNVQWSIVNPGNDAIAGISSNGTLLAVKPGNVEVQVTAENQEGNQITVQKTITINNKNIISHGYGTTVTASSTADDSSAPAKAVDAKENTWWRAENNDANQWFQMELMGEIPVSGLKIRWYEGNQPAAMKVLTSTDGTSWNEGYTRTTGIESDRDNYSEIIVFDTPVNTKYLLMESSKAGDNKTGIVEFEVYSDSAREIKEAVTRIEVSSDKDAIDKKSETLQMSATVSPETATEKRVEWIVTDLEGNETDVAEISADGILTPLKNGTVVVKANAVDGSGIAGSKTITITNQDLVNIALNKSANAGTNDGDAWKSVDGDLATRWGSSQWPNANWFQVNLEEEYWVHNVAVTFEVSHAKDFKLLVSGDGNNWTELTSVTDNSNLNWRFDLEEPVKANYIKLDVSRPSSNEWGFSIWEFEAYGKSTAVDLSALNTAIESAEEKAADEDKYTVDSYQAMLDKLEKAKALVNSEGLTQEAADAMARELSDAISGLAEKVIVIVDKEALAAKIVEAEAVDSAKYTEESLNALKLAIESAETLMTDEDATQEEVDTMSKTLEDAIAALILKTNKTALNAKIEEAKSYDSSQYTEESYKILESALKDAIEVQNSDNVTQEKVDEAVETLTKAIAALAKPEVKDPEDGSDNPSGDDSDTKPEDNTGNNPTGGSNNNPTGGSNNKPTSGSSSKPADDSSTKSEDKTTDNSIKDSSNGATYQGTYNAPAQVDQPQSQSEAPATGDNAPIMLWSVVCVAMLGTAAGIIRKKRK